ncbi:MAG: serine/threonine-protein kinase [Kofleriaceae bacterium]
MIGAHLGEYQLLHALRSGGMGDVLLARRHGPGGFEQLCAIKTVRAELAVTPAARAMFFDEARLLARLTHPAITQILDFGEADGLAYLVMEYVPGMSFRGLGDLRPPPAVLCQAMAAACRGLHAAHELRDPVAGHLLGVVHRDVSPDNLMLGFDGRVKVLDFGIALVRGRQAPVTELGTLRGKPPYMSPEQLGNRALDRRADVFSSAVVLWELLTGRPLFTGDSIYAVAKAVEEQPIVAPSTVAGPLPDGLDQLVLAGLARDPDQRLATAAAMAEVLERIAAAATRTSLAAWVDGALAEPRELHRRWLAGVLRGAPAGGRPGEASPRSRRAGLDATPTLPSAPASTPAGARAPDAAADVEAAAPAPAAPDRLGAAAVVTSGLLGGGACLGLAGWGGVATRAARPAVDAAGLDVPVIDAAGLDAAGLDAVGLDVPVIDAAVVDAPAARRPLDAGRPSRDAAAPAPIPDAGPPVPAPVDATPAPARGFLAIGAWSPAAKVLVDGEDWRSTPVLRRALPVGRHEVVLVSPLDGAVVLRRSIDVGAGQTVTIAPP